MVLTIENILKLFLTNFPTDQLNIKELDFMINILCYGDSNTWGYIPGSGGRYRKNLRWTGVLQNKLGEGYNIIEEGLNGRTTVFDDPYTIGYQRNGKKILANCLMSHKPLDMILIMLGTNDLKRIYNANPYEIAKGIDALIQIVKSLSCGNDNNVSPEIRIISPPALGNLSEFADQFVGASNKINLLPKEYKRVADVNSVLFFNATEKIKGSNIDGVHLDEKNHQRLGELLAKWIIN